MCQRCPRNTQLYQQECSGNGSSLWWTFVWVAVTVGDCGEVTRRVVSQPITEQRPQQAA